MLLIRLLIHLLFFLYGHFLVGVIAQYIIKNETSKNNTIFTLYMLSDGSSFSTTLLSFSTTFADSKV